MRAVAPLVTLLAALGGALAACGSAERASDDPDCVHTVPLAPAATIVPGQWVARTSYTILMSFEPQGKVIREDQVAPCPPNGQCVWAGVVWNKATWRAEGDTLYLDWVEPSPGHDVSAPPTMRLVRACDGGVTLAEPSGLTFHPAPATPE